MADRYHIAFRFSDGNEEYATTSADGLAAFADRLRQPDAPPFLQLIGDEDGSINLVNTAHLVRAIARPVTD